MNDSTNPNEYRVLARKYRPQLFENLIGQETLVQTISSSILNNRVAHAYLLTGVRGVGKTTTARLIAMALNCENRSDQIYEPCNKCESCKSIKEDRNLDVIEMDAASKTGVDDIREIIDNVKYKPIHCKYKIFIIDEVHMLSKNAFNALLKTLEEPPPHIKFIFATTEVKKIPITIISRCQRFDLHRITSSILTDHLFAIAKKEKVKIDNNAMAMIVRAADGSVRDGLSLLDQAIANESGEITEKTVNLMLALADRSLVFDLLDAIFDGNAPLALEIFHKLYNAGADILMIFDEILKIIHFLTRLKISPTIKDDIYIPELERSRGLKMVEKIDMISLGRFWQIVFKGYQELQHGSHLNQLGEIIIIRLIYLYNGPSPDDLVSKIETKIEKNNKDNDEKNLLQINKENESNKLYNSNNKTIDDSAISKDIKKNIISVNSYRDFVNLFYQKREGILHTHLYNSAKLISFKEGDLILNIENVSYNNFTRILSRFISMWTGRIWTVSSSNSNIGKTLQEEDIINQQKEIELIKKNKEINKILHKFEGVNIHSITTISETSDEKNFNHDEKKLKEE